jgi:hypothetical protein
MIVNENSHEHSVIKYQNIISFIKLSPQRFITP